MRKSILKSLVMSLIMTVCSISVVALGQAGVEGQTANSIQSRFFGKQRLSPEVCGDIVKEVSRIGADKTVDAQLNALLDAIAVECEIDNRLPQINFPAVMYSFSNSDLKILWDGQIISVNEKAQLTLDITVPRSFNHFVVVGPRDIEPHRKPGTGIIDKLITQLKKMKDGLTVVAKDGQPNLIISGYAYHDRRSYTPEKIQELNERAYGIGIENVIINDNGNREAVGMMVISDSHSDPQFSVNYEWQKGFSLTNNLKLWGGYSAGLVMRSDFKYLPMPFVFPTAGLSVGRINIKSVLIPKLGGNMNHGAVIFVFVSTPIT